MTEAEFDAITKSAWAEYDKILEAAITELNKGE